MANKVMIVTDSTNNLPESLMEGLPISVVPLHLIFNASDIYLDGVNITPGEFYTKLQNEKAIVSTSQPTPAALAQRYSQLVDEGYDILSIHISSKLSGTINSAEQARKTLPGANIELVDSLLASMPLGFCVLKAAQAAVSGASLLECKQIAEETARRSSAIFIVDTLEYLHRGGRIGGASAFFGTALNIKPVLELDNGIINAAGRVRTLSKAMDYMLERFHQQVKGHTGKILLSALHAESPTNARILLERAIKLVGINSSERIIAEVSPVIGAHVGPGTIGIAYALVE
ncbi:MAG: DegV family protein [Anaerolineae bacterium]|nr:DegV family protein [Anaerolineae bacterium]